MAATQKRILITAILLFTAAAALHLAALSNTSYGGELGNFKNTVSKKTRENTSGKKTADDKDDEADEDEDDDTGTKSTDYGSGVKGGKEDAKPNVRKNNRGSERDWRGLSEDDENRHKEKTKNRAKENRIPPGNAGARRAHNGDDKHDDSGEDRLERDNEESNPGNDNSSGVKTRMPVPVGIIFPGNTQTPEENNTYMYTGAPIQCPCTDDQTGTHSAHSEFFTHKKERLSLRLRAARQFIQPDITADDLGMEIGYAGLGVNFRITGYKEHDPRDRMTVYSGHGLFRLGYNGPIELQLGLGFSTIDTGTTESGVSLTAPIFVHITEDTTVSFRPKWTSINEVRINDYDISIESGFRHLRLLGGYRWLVAEHASLNGPYLGAALVW